MIWLLILMWLVGIFLSAFFSGTETGFFRVTRVRLMLDGLGGDPFARALLWLTNNPALFVATTLIAVNSHCAPLPMPKTAPVLVVRRR